MGFLEACLDEVVRWNWHYSYGGKCNLGTCVEQSVGSAQISVVTIPGGMKRSMRTTLATIDKLTPFV